MTFSPTTTTTTPHAPPPSIDDTDPWAIQPVPLPPPPPPPEPEPTQEELIQLKRRERLQKKQLKALQVQASKAARLEAQKVNEAASNATTTMRFKPRPWLRREGMNDQRRTVTLLSWNMLAQALVRRELFPGSDFLKIKTRIPTLMAEVLHYSPSLVCLQEVDHFETHREALEQADYDVTYHIGYETKPHGVLIAHQADLFDKVDQLELRFDEEKIRSSSTSIQVHEEDPLEERRTRALSRSTRNIALFVALKHKPSSSSSSLSSREEGLIVGTTHLFWHPTHVYERVRQTYLFAERAEKYRVEMEQKHGGVWRLILAGDLNTQPNEITYALLKRVPLTTAQTHDFEASCVIHQSVDKMYDPSYEPMEQVVKEVGEGEEAAEDPDKVIKNSRAPNEADGLLSLEEFKLLYATLPHVRSAYGEIHGLFPEEQAQWYVERPPGVESSQGWKIIEDPKVVEQRRQGSWDERVTRGDFEPMYTNYTPLWRCCLDYILALEKQDGDVGGVEWTGLMRMHRRDEMGDGLPKLGVEPSDHLAVACEFVLPS